MKRFLSLLFALISALFLFVGCSKPASGGTGGAPIASNVNKAKLSVVSTIFPGYDFVREVAGENVTLTMLLPPAAESHSFEPTPQNIIAIQNCDVFIYVGGESESWVDGILDSMDKSKMTIISMMELVETIEEEHKEGMEVDHEHADSHSEDDHEEHEEHEEYDEHVWTSPINASHITQAIADALCALDADNEEIYRANAAAYTEKLNKLDSAIRNVVQNSPRNTLIFGDRFPFLYLANEYDLDYYAAFPGCSTATQASPKTVAFMIDKVKQENIPVVFYIEFSNEKTADAICESTGAKKMLLHSCHNVTKDEFERGVSYLQLMTKNVENLKEALR